MPTLKTTIPSLLAISALLFPARVQAADQLFLQHYRIRQNHSVQNGVWISRPLPVDEFIFGFLRRNNIQDIDGYCHWLAGNLSYRQDVQDTWFSPQDTIDRKGGDCEDFALLNSAILNVLGYHPRILALLHLGQNHAICAFQLDGYYAWFDNQKLIRTTAHSFPEFTKYILQQTAATKIAELDPENQHWQLIARHSL